VDNKIIVPKNEYDLSQSKDHKDFTEEIVKIPDADLQKKAELNTFIQIVDPSREVPYKMKEPGKDSWLVGKCLKSQWNNISKFAEAITWEKYSEMNFGMKMTNKTKDALRRAIYNRHRFSFVIKTLKNIDILPNPDDNLTIN